MASRRVEAELDALDSLTAPSARIPWEDRRTGRGADRDGLPPRCWRRGQYEKIPAVASAQGPRLPGEHRVCRLPARATSSPRAGLGRLAKGDGVTLRRKGVLQGTLFSVSRCETTPDLPPDPHPDRGGWGDGAGLALKLAGPSPSEQQNRARRDRFPSLASCSNGSAHGGWRSCGGHSRVKSGTGGTKFP